MRKGALSQIFYALLIRKGLYGAIANPSLPSTFADIFFGQDSPDLHDFIFFVLRIHACPAACGVIPSKKAKSS